MIAENVPENISVCIFMFDEKKKNYYAVLSSIALWAFNSIFFPNQCAKWVLCRDPDGRLVSTSTGFSVYVYGGLHKSAYTAKLAKPIL